MRRDLLTEHIVQRKVNFRGRQTISSRSPKLFAVIVLHPMKNFGLIVSFTIVFPWFLPFFSTSWISFLSHYLSLPLKRFVLDSLISLSFIKCYYIKSPINSISLRQQVLMKSQAILNHRFLSILQMPVLITEWPIAVICQLTGHTTFTK